MAERIPTFAELNNGAIMTQSTTSNDPVSVLRDEALTAAEQWAERAYWSAENRGKGGPGFEDEVDKLCNKTSAAIHALALAATDRAAIQPAGEDDCPLTRSVYGSKEALDAEIARRAAQQDEKAGQDEIAAVHELLSKHCVAVTQDGAPMSLCARIEELYSWYTAIANQYNPAAPEGKTEASELPPLPSPLHRGPDGTGSYFDSYTADQMHQHAMDCVITRMADVQKVLREVGAPRSHADGSRMNALDRIRALAARPPVAAAPDAEALARENQHLRNVIHIAAQQANSDAEAIRSAARESAAWTDWPDGSGVGGYYWTKESETAPVHLVHVSNAKDGHKLALWECPGIGRTYVDFTSSRRFKGLPSPAVKSAEPTGGAA